MPLAAAGAALEIFAVDTVAFARSCTGVKTPPRVGGARPSLFRRAWSFSVLINQNRSSKFTVLTRFPYANRYPLRSKTL